MKSIIHSAAFFPCCFIGTLTIFEANIYLSILMAEDTIFVETLSQK